MADEIVSKLGFHVEDALAALDRLDTKLREVQGTFQQFGAALGAWNASTAGPVNVLTTIADNASRAASAVGRLNRAYAQVLAPPASSVAGPSGSLPAASPQGAPQLWLPPDYSQAAASARQCADAVKDTEDATKKAHDSTQKWVVSWETLARVVATQAIVRALSAIRDALHEAVSSAVDFQRAVAEIRTIAPAMDRDFGSLASEVASFSKNFNFPLPQVAEGLYQTLSNQFTSAADRANVMAASMKLAKVGVMELQDAVLLITGALNAYGMSSSAAEDVAAKFFTTIELGRTRGAELVPVIGRVAPVAAEAGVSLEELDAAIVSLTIGGMKVPEAATGLRAAISGLLKPSEDAQKALLALGYESGEQLIRAEGLMGALKKMAEAANLDTAETAKLFRNIRALNAELRLTGSGADKAAEALEKISKSSRQTLEATYQQFIGTDAEQLTRELNKLKVGVTQDVGQGLLEFLNGLAQAAGGANTLVTGLKGLLAMAVPVGTALGLMGGSMLAFSAASKIATAMNLAGWAGTVASAFGALVLPASVLVGTIVTIDAKLSAGLADAHEKFKAAQLDLLKEMEKRQQEAVKKEQRHYAELGRLYERSAAEVRKVQAAALEGVENQNRDVIENARTALESLVSTQERVVTALRSAANQAVQQYQASAQRQTELTARYADTQFKYTEKLRDAYHQTFDYLSRGLDLAGQAAAALSSAKSPEGAQAALAVFQRAQAHLQEADSIAKGTGNLVLQHKAEQAILKIIQEQIDAEKQFQALKDRQARQAAELAAREQDRVNQMKALTKEILKGLDLFDKGGPKSPGQRQQAEAGLQENVAKLRELWLGGQKIDLSDIMAFDSLQKRINTVLEGGISKVQVSRLFALPEAIDGLNEQINRGIQPIQVAVQEAAKMDPELSAMLRGKTAAEQMQTLGQQRQEAVEKIEQYRNKLNDATNAQTALNGASAGLSGIIQSWRADQEGWAVAAALGAERLARAVGSGQRLGETFEMFGKFMAEAEKFQRFPQRMDTKDLERAQQMADDLLKRGGLAGYDRETVERLLQQMKAVAEQSERLKAARQEEPWNEAQLQKYLQRADDIQKAMEAARQAVEPVKQAAGDAAANFGRAATSANGLAQTDMSGLVGQIGNAVRAMWELRDAAQAAAVASAAAASGGGGGADYSGDIGYDLESMLVAAGGLIQRRALGGLIRYFDRGGFAPRGSDTIPAMLSPGEFVMNARSTRRFYSQLLAMNAGVAPAFRSHGGEPASVTVGDIHINGASQPRETAREVIRSIKRELRRGTSVW